MSKTHTTSSAPAPGECTDNRLLKKSNTSPLYLALAPATVDHLSVSNTIIDLVHSTSADPNFLLLSATSSKELSEKANGFQGTYLSQRQAALDIHLRPRGIDEAPLSSRYKAVLEAKNTRNSSFLEVYNQASSSPPPPGVTSFFERSKKAWQFDLKEVLDSVEKTLKESHSGIHGAKEPASIGPDAQTAAHAARSSNQTIGMSPLGLNNVDLLMSRWIQVICRQIHLQMDLEVCMC